MPLATIRPAGEAGLYHIHFLDQRVDPGYGHPIGGGHPDQGLPGYGHPDQGLPGSGAYPDQGLPGGRPPHVGGRPPGSFNPVFPDNSLPGGPPPHVNPGETIVLVRDPAGVWHYAKMPTQAVPPPVPDNTLPPPVAQPKR